MAEAAAGSKEMHKKVVVLTGPSGCGKSSVCEALRGRIPTLRIISQDDYFGFDAVPYAGALSRLDDSMELHTQVDWARLVSAVESAVAELREGEWLIVEGHVVAQCELIVRRLARCVVSLCASQQLCCERRIGRRQRSAEEDAVVRDYYNLIVARAHARHVVPTLDALRARADPPVHEISCERALEEVVSDVLAVVASSPSPGGSEGQQPSTSREP
jgi:uridine kinase